MDNFEYLKQISASTRPAKPATSREVSKSLIAKIAIGGIVLFFLIMSLGLLLGNLGGKSNQLTLQLYVRTTNVNTTVTKYNSSLKSSRLRAIGVSLSTVLTNASNQLSNYITDGGENRKALTPDESLAKTEADLTNQLDLSLNNSKLNGILDRSYDNEIGLQVSLLLSLISQLRARTNDADLIKILENYHSSLYAIHQNIEAYSNPGD